MAIIKLKPNTPGTRFMSISSFEEITKVTPEKSLTVSLRKSGGRNNLGHVTAKHIGGGHKRRYRIIDFKREYILAPDGLKVGDKIQSGTGSDITIGNALPLKDMPFGSFVHNVELKPGKGGQLGRSAGASIQVMAKEGDYAQLKMPSGEVRLIRLNCLATYGIVGNSEQENISFGKAGRTRWIGKRPHVRGVAMNPVDHPMGGGEGKTSGGGHPVSPWGQKAKGLKTRKRKKESNKLIIKRRK
ncbi:MAG: 50S ribosomal protein L2 [Ignavibacteriaceae bacterium]